MLPIPLTVFVTGIFALMLIALSLNVSLRRRDLKLARGDGGDEALQRRVRAHGNFIENAPFCIFVVLALEAVLATSGIIWLVAGAFIIARILHAWGTLSASLALIAPAMLIQHAVMFCAAIWLLIQSI
ncbi:MAPEG family protein [Thalassospira sp. MCCC 1A03138]|uniref:MAPEG family protein n=1 Tax=Thalassospira sp. MCCC 1A03138 TaxID=1470576 RepID=UPI000A1E3094|nr:MAPEG family protein [Thalassospira sp. MCCC 1A03138]OSQ32290.1 hypothetical protein TH468_01310 [Thalassospira sp. MCCC 1A03138]